jgi:hypothetical protein
MTDVHSPALKPESINEDQIGAPIGNSSLAPEMTELSSRLFVGESSYNNGIGPDDLPTGLYVSNLEWYTTDKELIEAFGSFGSLTALRMYGEKLNAKSRGFAYVEYAEGSIAALAQIRMNGWQVHGRALSVNFTTPAQLTALTTQPMNRGRNMGHQNQQGGYHNQNMSNTSSMGMQQMNPMSGMNMNMNMHPMGGMMPNPMMISNMGNMGMNNMPNQPINEMPPINMTRIQPMGGMSNQGGHRPHHGGGRNQGKSNNFQVEFQFILVIDYHCSCYSHRICHQLYMYFYPINNAQSCIHFVLYRDSCRSASLLCSDQVYSQLTSIRFNSKAFTEIQSVQLEFVVVQLNRISCEKYDLLYHCLLEMIRSFVTFLEQILMNLILIYKMPISIHLHYMAA